MVEIIISIITTLIQLFLFSVGTLLTLYLLFRIRKSYRGYRYGSTPLPGPSTLPFLGNVRTFLKHKRNTLPLFLKWVEEYGNTYRFTVLGDKDIILVNDPESIKHVLRSVDVKSSQLTDSENGSSTQKWS